MAITWVIPRAALELAKAAEGFRAQAYHDPVGYPTIGYGHLLSRSKWADLSQWREELTVKQAETLLAADMGKAAIAVNRLIDVRLTDDQRAALIDFTFNLGEGALADSTLRTVLNRGDYGAVPAEFRRWVYAGGVKLEGLVTRREAEVKLFSGKPENPAPGKAGEA